LWGSRAVEVYLDKGGQGVHRECTRASERPWVVKGIEEDQGGDEPLVNYKCKFRFRLCLWWSKKSSAPNFLFFFFNNCNA
jgi:hypothetical protein